MTTQLSILHTESSTGWGGQEIRILTEAGGFLDRGHRVKILTPANAELLPAARKLGIPVEAIDIERKGIGSYRAMRAWLKEYGASFDVVNTHSSTDSWLVALANRNLPGAPPMVRTRHVSTAINNKFSTRWLYNTATAHIVTTGEALRTQLFRDNDIALDRMTSVRTGIDLVKFHPHSKYETRKRMGLPNQPTMGILATLRDWKGHDYLLDAFVRLRERFPQWHLLIIGDGPQRQRLEGRVHEMQLGERVRFVGNVDNVPDWLSVLDIFALPSYGDEGVPQGIMQAMACGVPVVSTPVGAIREAVQENLTGLIVPPRDAKALAHGLEKLMSSATLRAEFSEAAIAYAQKNFGINVMLDRMTEVFGNVVSNAHNQGSAR